MKINPSYSRTVAWPGLLLALLLCICAPLSWSQAIEWHFQGVERIVAVGDVHGDCNALIATLQRAGVIDTRLAWSGGQTHLVMTGDLLDRGPESRRAMDLIMRLEQEAVRAGGQVHQLLGNHEVMNLIGDLRYVSDAEYAAFGSEESVQEREYWYERYRDSLPAGTDEQAARPAFAERAPPGFFAHRRAFLPTGHYGRWLLRQPLMIVVNGTAFVHGGMSPFVAEHGLAGVNGALRENLLNHVTALAALVDKGQLSPIDGFHEYPAILARKLQSEQPADAIAASMRVVIESGNSPLHKPEGPLWYRGTASCGFLVEGDVLAAALSRVGAQRVVIGHTMTDSRRVEQHLHGRAILIDTGMLNSSYHGSGNALVIEGESVSVVNQHGETKLPPITPPRRVGYESQSISDDVLARILLEGTIDAIDADAAAWQVVRVTDGDAELVAYFTALPGDQRSAPELAAYRLDRMLGLDMIPVTVRRKVADQSGTLQYLPTRVLNERDRAVVGNAEQPPCPLQRQKGAMHVFDALIHNTARTPLAMLYSPDKWQLILVNHESAFGAEEDLPSYLGNTEPEVGDQWRAALLELDDERLRDNLQDVLEQRQLEALAKRRDALLEGSRR